MDKEFNSDIYGMLPTDIKEVASLAALALDIRWSWNHEADELWQQLDPALWELTHNPWIVLQTVSRDQLERQLADPAFSGKINELLKLKEEVSYQRRLVSTGASQFAAYLHCLFQHGIYAE